MPIPTMTGQQRPRDGSVVSGRLALRSPPHRASLIATATVQRRLPALAPGRDRRSRSVPIGSASTKTTRCMRSERSPGSPPVTRSSETGAFFAEAKGAEERLRDRHDDLTEDVFPHLLEMVPHIMRLRSRRGLRVRFDVFLDGLKPSSPKKTRLERARSRRPGSLPWTLDRATRSAASGSPSPAPAPASSTGG